MISIRVREEIKKLLEESGLDIGEEIRKYLEELAWKVKIKRMIEKWDIILRDVRPSEVGFSEKSVREDRESH
ncbi:MAG: VapB-type antitoxin [Candidatus Bathyarchaeia archaeon]